MGKGPFQAFRETGRPSYYDENKWPVTVDIAIYGLIFCFLALLFSFYVVLIGVRGIERLYAFIRVTVSLFIGAVILICNFGYGWEYGSVTTTMEYKAFTAAPVKAELGLKVGLRGINITLVGIPKEQLNTTINYNERFSWQWAQGKAGFGPQDDSGLWPFPFVWLFHVHFLMALAMQTENRMFDDCLISYIGEKANTGSISREYKAAHVKGLPYPILWTAEYFIADEGNFRHGRYYRIAGWYCHTALWIAFPLWLLSNILFFMVLRYGAYYLALTGSVLLLTNILFCSIRNESPLVLHFNSLPLTLHYNWCFYLVLFTGILCICLAIAILFMDLRYPEEIATFLGVDILQDYEDFYADPADLGHVPVEVRVEPSSSAENQSLSKEQPSQEVLSLRKRTFSKRFQRHSRRNPVPAPRKLPYHPTPPIGKAEFSSELPVYENIDLTRFDPIGEEEEETKEGSQEQIIVPHAQNSDL